MRDETIVADTAVEPEQRTLVLTAFPAEADAILARTTLDENPVVVVQGRHYYLGTLGGTKVVVAMTGIGMKNAADTTKDVLTQFSCDSGVAVKAVVFAGVAGGHGRTQIGDVAVPARWTADHGTTWHAVDPEMLDAANQLRLKLESSCRVRGPLLRRRMINLDREPQVHVGGDGSSGDHNNGAALPAIPLGGTVFGPQPLAAPDFSRSVHRQLLPGGRSIPGSRNRQQHKGIGDSDYPAGGRRRPGDRRGATCRRRA